MAAEETGVPQTVLQAIALAESGRNRGGHQRPWPWTVNFGGDGTWYDSSGEARRAVAAYQAEGGTNFDIGCFQINHRWHAGAFPDVAAMFDPTANALYAAQFLLGLFAETGSWPDAAAAYHSRTPEHADRYRARFNQLHDGLDTGGQMPLLAGATRENRFPLLQAGATGSLGSLVPQVEGGFALIGAAP
ncbi:MAG: transglycosylase SLT domain-containing protein [Rhodobacter sp.]|nr:transglycosylase SLT domain-containing protein [Rhodobacter sp.]